MERTAATLRGKLTDHQRRFVEKMPLRVEAINETLARCAQHDRSALDRLERLFHTLAGTAGTFGLNAVAAAAAEAEEACNEFHRAALRDEDVHYLRYLVDQIRTAMNVKGMNGNDAAAA